VNLPGKRRLEYDPHRQGDEDLFNEVPSLERWRLGAQKSALQDGGGSGLSETHGRVALGKLLAALLHHSATAPSPGLGLPEYLEPHLLRLTPVPHATQAATDLGDLAAEPGWTVRTARNAADHPSAPAPDAPVPKSSLLGS
jgi:hypothetical protein|tara:strand:- start:234 stop:656 length:423 start_codon:yes stop_codon:yes gene_type:complete